MHRVKFNDYAELLSDDLNNNNAYLYNGLITTIADFIAANDCVSGLEVTAQAVPDMTVYVKAGRIYQDGYQGFLEADLTTPLTIAPASANQPRIDLICAKYEEVEDEPEIRNVMTDVVSRNITQVEVKTRIASSIAFQVVGGTAAAEPTVPTTPEGWVALAKVTIPANTSVIQQSNIVDMRPKIINIYQHDHSGGANGAKLDYNNLENLPDLSVFKGATTSNNGTKGMVPAPAKGNNNRYLKSDATWGEIDTMKGATSSAAGAAGLVPAPAKGDHGKALLGDGTWELLIKAIAEASGTITVTKSDGSTATVKQILKAIQDGNGNNIVNTYATKTELSAKAPLASPALTGTPTAPTAAKTTDSTQIATTAFVKDVVADYATLTQLNAKAPLASPTFTGSPKSTTPASSDNSTRIATTAFVKALVGAANNGGIVSANLAQNGYVKFANGFILQWGQFVLNNSGLSSANTLPLSFSNKNYVLTPYLAVQKNAYIDAYVNYYSASQFKYFGGAGTYRYIASGW